MQIKTTLVAAMMAAAEMRLQVWPEKPKSSGQVAWRACNTGSEIRVFL